MHQPVKIAVFGVGRWGTHLLRTFLNHPRSQVIAVVDPNLDALDAIAQTLQLDDRVFLTTQWEDALDMRGLDAVVIATPAATHAELITAALKRGLHVLAEKPLTLTVAESVQLCRLAKEENCQLVVDHTYLFHPAIDQGKLFLAMNRLGPVRYGYATRSHLGPIRRDVDALWDLAIHDIAIFNHWLGELPNAVGARAQGWLQRDPLDLFPNGLCDTVWATLSYPSGFQATLHLSWANPDKQRRLSVVGDQGSLIFDELAAEMLTVQWGQVDRERLCAIDLQKSAIAVPPEEPLQQLANHFLTCIQTNQPSSRSSGWVGAELVHILVALSESMQTGTPVEIKPLKL